MHQADVSAVLIATTECMLEGLKAGKQVDFGDLGAFRLQINSGGAPSADLFTSDYIKGVNIQSSPARNFKSSSKASSSTSSPPGRPSRRHQGPEGR